LALGTYHEAIPQGSITHPCTIVVAFNPQFTLVASGVNNDNLVTPIATWAILLLVDIWQKGPTVKKLPRLRLLSGLAAMSKLSGAALLGLASWF
jgi:4-amino-4-deoxy-L-arabinose transferase-like glycosyltransferase